jgi:hypothetical protein
MRDDRLARALLRLYPRKWRTRYGDEFLEFIDDSGLSWHGVANVVAAAGAERVRVLVTLVRSDDDPTSPQSSIGSVPVRGVLAEHTAYFVLVSLSFWVGSGFGVPYPQWLFWLNIFFVGGGRFDVPSPDASWLERLAVSVFWFATAVAANGLAWLTGVLLGRAGAPIPSDPVFYTIAGTWVVCAGGRMLYCLVQSMWIGSTWKGMHRREIYTWSAALFVVGAVLALTDPSEALRGFWPLVMIFCMTLRPPIFVTRAGAAKTRADYEKIFGSG